MGTEAPLFGAIWRNPFVGSECDVIQMKKRFHLDDKPEDFLKKKLQNIYCLNSPVSKDSIIDASLVAQSL